MEYTCAKMLVKNKRSLPTGYEKSICIKTSFFFNKFKKNISLIPLAAFYFLYSSNLDTFISRFKTFFSHQ